MPMCCNKMKIIIACHVFDLVFVPTFLSFSLAKNITLANPHFFRINLYNILKYKIDRCHYKPLYHITVNEPNIVRPQKQIIK